MSYVVENEDRLLATQLYEKILLELLETFAKESIEFTYGIYLSYPDRFYKTVTLHKRMREKLIHTFLEKNKKLNLSAIRDAEGVRIKHIQDALELLKLGIFQPGMNVADIGTGGGFPLMPLAIALPELLFTGIDSVKKKTLAVNEMLAELGVKNAKVMWTRVEEYHGESFDVITARAVAYVDKLFQRAFPLLEKGAVLLLMKQVIPEERSLLLQLCKKYGGKLEQEHHYQLFDGDIQRVIYGVRKG